MVERKARHARIAVMDLTCSSLPPMRHARMPNKLDFKTPPSAWGALPILRLTVLPPISTNHLGRSILRRNVAKYAYKDY
jgi:hypothetical protein